MTMTREQSVEPTRSAVTHLPDPAVGFAVEDGVAVASGVNGAFRETFDVDSVDGTTELGTVLSELGVADAEVVAELLCDGTEADRIVTPDTTSEGTRGAFLLKSTTDGESGRVRLVGLPGDGGSGADRDTGGHGSSEPSLAPDSEWVASTIAHDVRNPLDVASAHLQAARETGDATHFESVADAHDRIETIVADVLTLVRGDGIERESVDLAATARSAWNSVRTGDATLSVESPLPQASGDRERLERLFENLFRNAVEHAGPDPAVRIGRIESDSADSDTDGPESGTDELSGFYVADDGPGVPPDRRGDLFESGVSTDNDGTGLGLAISARIIRSHGWQIRLGNGRTSGARFEVTGLDDGSGESRDGFEDR